MRMTIAFLLLSVQVFSQPTNRGSGRYSGYSSSSPYPQGAFNQHLPQEYKNLKIIDEEQGTFSEAEELDPRGFIPEVKPISPTYKHTTPVYKHTIPSYRHTSPLYKHSTATYKPVVEEQVYEEEVEEFEDKLKKKVISKIKEGIQKQINDEVAKHIVEEVRNEEKRRVGIVDLLWKILQVFLERRQLDEKSTEKETSETKSRTKRQAKEPRCAGLKTQVSNKTRGQTTVTIGNLSVEGREDLYEEISCEIEDVEEDGGEMKEADDDDGEGGDGSDESGSSSSEEEPDDDGMGGGILGILVGLSGEGGMSDLGTLLTTVSGIITNLSGGPEFDLDTIIGSAVGLFAGVSGGDGTIPFGKLSAQYYITSFEGFSGGGAMLNGKFIGDLLNGIITGSSLVEDEEDYDAEPTKDSITFYRALFAALFGSNSENEGGGDGGDY